MLRITLETAHRNLSDSRGLEIEIRAVPLLILLELFHPGAPEGIQSGYLHTPSHLTAHAHQQRRKTHVGTCDAGDPSRQTVVVNSRGFVILSAGQQAEIVANGRNVIFNTKPSDPEPERPLHWRQGRIAFSGEPLAELVAEYNRYNKGKLVITDDAIVNLRIAGLSCPTKVEDLLTFLRAQHGITAVTLSSGAGQPQVIALAGTQQPHRIPKGSRK